MFARVLLLLYQAVAESSPFVCFLMLAASKVATADLVEARYFHDILPSTCCCCCSLFASRRGLSVCFHPFVLLSYRAFVVLYVRARVGLSFFFLLSFSTQ